MCPECMQGSLGFKEQTMDRTPEPRRWVGPLIAAMLAVPAWADHDRSRAVDVDLEDVDARGVLRGDVLDVELEYEVEADDWDGRALLLVIRPLVDDYALADADGELVEFVFAASPIYRDDDDYELKRRVYFELALGRFAPDDLRLLGLVVDPATGLILDEKTARIHVHRPGILTRRCDRVAGPHVSAGIRVEHLAHVGYRRRVLHRRVVRHHRLYVRARPTIGVAARGTIRPSGVRTSPSIIRHEGRTIQFHHRRTQRHRKVVRHRGAVIRRHR